MTYAIWIKESYANFGNASHHDSEVVVVESDTAKGRHCYCCCSCCDWWSLEKMKPLADKLVVSLSEEMSEREEDATTLTSCTWMVNDAKIECCKRTH